MAIDQAAYEEIKRQLLGQMNVNPTPYSTAGYPAPEQNVSAQEMQDMIMGRAANPSNYNVQDLVNLHKSGTGDYQPVPTPSSDQPTTPGQQPGSQQSFQSGFQQSQFQGTMPAPEMMSLDEMMEIVNRRAELMTQPKIDALGRQLEEEQLSGERRKGELESDYQRALRDLEGQQMGAQQITSQAMARRNVYDSGMAADLANRIARSGMQMGLQLSQEQSRVLADLAEYLDLRTRHTNEEITELMGYRGQMAADLLAEMHNEQQNRRDMLAQREFENWLANESLNLQQQMASLDEYWRQQEFDARQSAQEWDRWAWGQEFDARQHDQEWDRIMQMNDFQLRAEIERLLANNQIDQWEAEFALSQGDQAMKDAVYRAQYGSAYNY